MWNEHTDLYLHTNRHTSITDHTNISKTSEHASSLTTVRCPIQTIILLLTEYHITQTCLPQNNSVSTPNSLCLYFQIFDWIFFFFFGGCNTSQSKQKSHRTILYHSLCKNSVWYHIFNYKDALQNWHTMTLRCLLLFTSVKVILDQRPQNTFSKSNAPRVLLSLMLMHPLLNVRWQHIYLVTCILPPLPPLCETTASNSNLPYQRMANFHKALNAKSMFIGLNNFFDQSEMAVYFSPKNGLKYTNVNKR